MKVLQKAGLRSLNEMVAATSATMVWKSKKFMDPLCALLFPVENESISEKMMTRSACSNNAKTPVPGYNTLAANLLARAWNEATDLQNASNLFTAKVASKKWARSLQFKT